MNRNSRIPGIRPLLVLAVLAGAGALEGAAQEGAVQLSAAGMSTDSRWLPWLGCWEPEVATAGAMLCFVPVTSDAGVDMATVAEGREVSRERLYADGAERESSREGCVGNTRARFSDDSRRVYLEATHTCGSDLEQRTSGMLALLSPTEWIDVRTVSVGEDSSTGVSRYRLAPIDLAEEAGFGNVAADQAMAVRAARVQVGARIGVKDVIDASRNVAPDVVRAWIAERREPFRLDADELIRMADAGVSPDVVDVVVAVSYPRQFSLGEGVLPDADRRVELASGVVTVPVSAGYGQGFFWDPFFGAYGYGYGYGLYDRYYDRIYGPGFYDRYGYPGAFRPTVVYVEPREETRGRVVNGRGYTRTRPTSPSTPSAEAPRSSSSNSEGSSSNSGSSDPSSGRGTPTGRTAQPRPSGG